jgi:hypothetical protein
VNESSFASRHFSLSNPLDDRPESLPMLLRRVAEELDRRGIAPGDILDVTVSSQTESFGPYWSVTVYWDPDAS